jgi:hypothetical protein
VTQEALCFIERYPDRKDELIRRIREGRVFVSPYLCNSLWAFQSFEGAIRTFYPARRMATQWGIALDVAEHIEEPSLPWGVASILAGCGIRWLSVPFYGYDSTFGGLENPPVFMLEGPDGARVRVVMDAWASGRWSYTQGAHLLRNPDAIAQDWLPHYAALGEAYPLRSVLASGTHGDISPHSGDQAREFAEAIARYNAQRDAPAKLVNATLRQFCEAADEAQAREPFMPVLRGCFGHSWDLWPLCLAKYAGDMREGERAFLAAEALLSVARRGAPELDASARAELDRAEWCWSMLADHAWNGTDEENKRHNADLRRQWSEEFVGLGQSLLQRGWERLGLERTDRDLILFNGLSVPRADLVRIEPPPDVMGVSDGGAEIASQIVEEDARRVLYLVSPTTPAFGLGQLRLTTEPTPETRTGRLRATPTELESPFYRLRVDLKTGGLASLVHKATGAELLASGARRTLCQTVYFDGTDRTLTDVRSDVAANGPVLARLRIIGSVGGIGVTSFVTVYADLDRVDFDVRIEKPAATQEERLCQVFPVVREGAVVRVETTGAVIRPRPQPGGDLLPGADTRRFAVQGFVDASGPGGVGVTIAPREAFALRMDLDPITFEALGSDQNHREVLHDQNGVRSFRFRYSLRAHEGGYDGAAVVAWSRSATPPLLAALGRLPNGSRRGAGIEIDPARAIATCLKPADARLSGRHDAAVSGCILRIWETAGRSGPLSIGLRGYARAIRTDLLEREGEELAVRQGKVTIDLPAHGLAAVRLMP